MDFSLESKIVNALGEKKFTLTELHGITKVDTQPLLRTLQYMYGKDMVTCEKERKIEMISGTNHSIVRILWAVKRKGTKPNELRQIGKPAPEPAPVKEVKPYNYGVPSHITAPVNPKGRMTQQERSDAIKAGMQKRREKDEEQRKQRITKAQSDIRTAIQEDTATEEADMREPNNNHLPEPVPVQAPEVQKKKIVRPFVPEISTELVFDKIIIFVGIPLDEIHGDHEEVSIPIDCVDALCLQLKELKNLHAQITPRK